jgi:hypothetical protein
MHCWSGWVRQQAHSQVWLTTTVPLLYSYYISMNLLLPKLIPTFQLWPNTKRQYKLLICHLTFGPTIKRIRHTAWHDCYRQSTCDLFQFLWAILYWGKCCTFTSTCHILNTDLLFRVWGCRLDWSRPGCGPMAGSCEHSNGSLGSIKNRRFIEYLSKYQLLKVGSAVCS